MLSLLGQTLSESIKDPIIKLIFAICFVMVLGFSGTTLFLANMLGNFIGEKWADFTSVQEKQNDQLIFLNEEVVRLRSDVNSNRKDIDYNQRAFDEHKRDENNRSRPIEQR